MSLADLITTYATGTYAVTRTATGSFTAGRFTAGATSSLNIDACVQPISGRDLQSLPDGRRGDETLVIYTKTLLRTADPNGAADLLSIGGSSYEVFQVNTWIAHFSDTYYRALASRVTPSGGP